MKKWLLVPAALITLLFGSLIFRDGWNEGTILLVIGIVCSWVMTIAIIALIPKQGDPR